MAWRALTASDINTQLSATELASIRAQAASGTDPVSDSSALVAERVRGYVAAHPSNRLGAAGTLPERLIGAAVALLVLELYGRTAGLLIDLNDTRKKAAESAVTLLRDVAAGRFAVELPESGTESAEDAKSASAELVTASARPLLRDDLAGL